MKANELKKLDKKNVYVETKYGEILIGHLNLAGDALVIGKEEYLVYDTEVKTIREV